MERLKCRSHSSKKVSLPKACLKNASDVGSGSATGGSQQNLTSVAMRDLPDLVHDTGTKVIGATARFTVHACWMLPNRFRFIYASDSLRGCTKTLQIDAVRRFPPAIDHGHIDPGFRSVRPGLVVFAEAAVPSQPGESPLHDPALGQHGEALGLWVFTHDVQRPGGVFRPPRFAGLRRTHCQPTAGAGREINRPSAAGPVWLPPSPGYAAGCTTTARSQPCVSTTMCRLRPFTFFGRHRTL